MKIKNNYTFLQKVYLVYCLFRTKIYWRKARLIRFPFEVRGKKLIDFGDQLTTGVGCRIEAFTTTTTNNNNNKIVFGKNVQINDYVHLSAMQSIIIGNNVLMASKIYISDNSHGFYKGNEFDSDPEIPPIDRNYFTSKVVIEDNVWIGEGVVILPGVTIGRGSIIGANSVVSKNVPEYSISVGLPAIVIKKFNFDTKKWEKV